jgi:hypoxanthine phosphoribosyltransferase
LHEDLERVLISEEELAQRVSELGAEISRDYAGKELVIVGVLKGSFVFMADLMRRITVPCTADFLAVSSYAMGAQTTGDVKVIKDLDMPVENRHVLIIEDILDSGVTLSYIMNLMAGKKIASVRLCALLDKPERRRMPVTPNYRGFSIPDEFVVGYGLDYAERFRYLPYVAVISKKAIR